MIEKLRIYLILLTEARISEYPFWQESAENSA